MKIVRKVISAIFNRKKSTPDCDTNKEIEIINSLGQGEVDTDIYNNDKLDSNDDL